MTNKLFMNVVTTSYNILKKVKLQGDLLFSLLILNRKSLKIHLQLSTRNVRLKYNKALSTFTEQ